MPQETRPTAMEDLAGCLERGSAALSDDGPRSTRPRWRRIGELLVQRGALSEEEVRRILQRQAAEGGVFGDMAAQTGVSQTQIADALAEQWGVSRYADEGPSPPQALLELLPAAMAMQHGLLPLALSEGGVTVALCNPLDRRGVEWLECRTDSRVQCVLATPAELQSGLRKLYGMGADEVERFRREHAVGEAQGDGASDRRGADGSAPEAVADAGGDDASGAVSQLLDRLLAQAVQDRATDLHLEPSAGRMRVRFRVDGALYDANVQRASTALHAALVSRVKVLAGLNVAERRLPQDGRFRAAVGGDAVDLRVSLLPTPDGESLNIRVLPQRFRYRLDELGLSAPHQRLVADMIQSPHGILFVSGPTGSGKTTTLYACLRRIDRDQRKVITIEDPIEYRMDGMTQIQVNPEIGLTFAQGLRSMLRHDPDIMMVGEVRDAETAQIAIRLSLTGHLVFSTIHTNSALGTIARLLDMGVEPYLLAASIVGVVAQRLVRVVCPQCEEGRGCPACRMTGYSGRTAIHEVAVFTERVRRLIAQRASWDALREEVFSGDTKTLRENGLERVRAGVTTLEEVLRVTQDAGGVM